MARYTYHHGATLRITDMRAEAQLAPAVESLGDIEAEYILGYHREEDIDWADIIIRNPAIRPDNPLLARARARRKLIVMEIPYFLSNCPARVIAVTGTKGKTTTTTMLHRFLRADGSSVQLAGNMGESAIGLLDELTSADEILLEVSSYQLEGFSDQSAPRIRIALITNVEDDHLDRYQTLERYRSVKADIASGQTAEDWLILPSWDPDLLSLSDRFPSRKVYISRGSVTEGPAEPGERSWNANIVSGHVVLHRGAGQSETIADLRGLRLRGAHNTLNAAFAAVAAYLAGRSPAQISGAVDSIAPVPHRLEPLGAAGQVEFINDSAASAPLAAVAAIEALTDKRIVAIIGGDDKGADRAPMLQALETAGASVVLLPGSVTPQLELDLSSLQYKYASAASMADAVTQAYDLARSEPGESVVLLSPGFSSHSAFVNEFDRGSQFCAAVARIVSQPA